MDKEKLRKRLAQLQADLLKKQKKLEKVDRRTKAKDHVQAKIKEHNRETADNYIPEVKGSQTEELMLYQDQLPRHIVQFNLQESSLPKNEPQSPSVVSTSSNEQEQKPSRHSAEAKPSVILDSNNQGIAEECLNEFTQPCASDQKKLGLQTLPCKELKIIHRDVNNKVSEVNHTKIKQAKKKRRSVKLSPIPKVIDDEIQDIPTKNNVGNEAFLYSNSVVVDTDTSPATKTLMSHLDTAPAAQNSEDLIPDTQESNSNGTSPKVPKLMQSIHSSKSTKYQTTKPVDFVKEDKKEGHQHTHGINSHSIDLDVTKDGITLDFSCLTEDSADMYSDIKSRRRSARIQPTSRSLSSSQTSYTGDTFLTDAASVKSDGKRRRGRPRKSTPQGSDVNTDQVHHTSSSIRYSQTSYTGDTFLTDTASVKSDSKRRRGRPRKSIPQGSGVNTDQLLSAKNDMGTKQHITSFKFPPFPESQVGTQESFDLPDDEFDIWKLGVGIRSDINMKSETKSNHGEDNESNTEHECEVVADSHGRAPSQVISLDQNHSVKEEKMLQKIKDGETMKLPLSSESEKPSSTDPDLIRWETKCSVTVDSREIVFVDVVSSDLDEFVEVVCCMKNNVIVYRYSLSHCGFKIINQQELEETVVSAKLFFMGLCPVIVGVTMDESCPQTIDYSLNLINISQPNVHLARLSVDDPENLQFTLLSASAPLVMVAYNQPAIHRCDITKYTVKDNVAVHVMKFTSVEYKILRLDAIKELKNCLVGFSSDAIHIWNIPHRALLRTCHLSLRYKSVSLLASEKGLIYFVGMTTDDVDTGAVMALNPMSGKALPLVKLESSPHSPSILKTMSVTCDDNYKHLCCLYEDGVVCLWDLMTGEILSQKSSSKAKFVSLHRQMRTCVCVEENRLILLGYNQQIQNK